MVWKGYVELYGHAAGGKGVDDIVCPGEVKFDLPKIVPFVDDLEPGHEPLVRDIVGPEVGLL